MPSFAANNRDETNFPRGDQVTPDLLAMDALVGFNLMLDLTEFLPGEALRLRREAVGDAVWEAVSGTARMSLGRRLPSRRPQEPVMGVGGSGGGRGAPRMQEPSESVLRDMRDVVVEQVVRGLGVVVSLEVRQQVPLLWDSMRELLYGAIEEAGRG